MRLLMLIEKTKKGKFRASDVYRLYMPNGGEDGVLVGWRADWPESHYTEFRGPAYSQWTGGQGSDFQRVHDALEGRHATVLHTNDVLEILPSHPGYDNIKNAVEGNGMPPESRGYAFEAHSESMDELFRRGYQEGNEAGFPRGQEDRDNRAIAKYDGPHDSSQRGRITRANVYDRAYSFGFQDGYYDAFTGGTRNIQEAMGIAPDMASKIIHKKDLEKYREWEQSGDKHMPYGVHAYRVTGWYCPRTPPKLTKDNIHDNMHDILSQILWDGGDDFDKMRPCQRKDATHVTGSGVSGIFEPIEDVVVVGRVNWSPEQIQQEKNSWNRRVMMGESIDPDRQQALSYRYQDPKLMELDLSDWEEGDGDWIHKPSGAHIGITGRAGKWVVVYPNGRLHKTDRGNRPSYFKTPSMAINVVMAANESAENGPALARFARLHEAERIQNFRGRRFNVYHNPSMAEIKGAMQESGEQMVGAWLIGNDWVVWNRYDGLHADVERALGLSDAIPVMLYITPSGKAAWAEVTDASKRTHWHHNPEVADAIMDHPGLNQYFNELDIGYYDSDIVGDWREIAENASALARYARIYEAPVRNFNVGDLDTEHSTFGATDRAMLQSPKAQAVARKRIETAVPIDINIYTIPGGAPWQRNRDRPIGDRMQDYHDEDYSQVNFNAHLEHWSGVMTPEDASEIIGQPIQANADSINALYLSNANKQNSVPLTPWMLMHRLGHSLEDAATKGHLGLDASEARDDLYSFYTRRVGYMYGANIKHVMTMKSARGDVVGDGDVVPELIAQYLHSGRIQLVRPVSYEPTRDEDVPHKFTLSNGKTLLVKYDEIDDDSEPMQALAAKFEGDERAIEEHIGIIVQAAIGQLVVAP